MNSLVSKPKIALCFIISYDHILNKEEIWREWIEYNKDIINVYFYYKDSSKIKSSWILEHLIPLPYIQSTSYMHVIPAYINSMNYIYRHDFSNKWFCFLTDSCCPIISPRRFRYLFFKNRQNSLMSWRPAWWNPYFHNRANLLFLPKEYHLANDSWFVLRREEVQLCMRFPYQYMKMYKTICDGGLANESLFAIIFRVYHRLEDRITKKNQIIPSPIKNTVTHLTDWSRMSSSTSPYVFREDIETNRQFIEEELKKNKHAMFLRKVAPEFPDETLRFYLYQYSKEKDERLQWNEKVVLLRWDWISSFLSWIVCLLFSFFLGHVLVTYMQNE